MRQPTAWRLFLSIGALVASSAHAAPTMTGNVEVDFDPLYAQVIYIPDNNAGDAAGQIEPDVHVGGALLWDRISGV